MVLETETFLHGQGREAEGKCERVREEETHSVHA